MPRPATPADLYRLRVPTEPRLSPDGTTVVFTVKQVSPGRDAYRQSIWAAPVDGSGEARRLTIGTRFDRNGRFSPDGRTLAFLSDRRLYVEEEPGRPADPAARDDCHQVHLLPLDGGEARRLTDLPRGVDAFAWSPDGRSLAVLTSSLGATIAEEERRRNRPKAPAPGEPPRSDYRYIDRLHYQHNGAGFVDDRIRHLWLVDVATGAARPLVVGPSPESGPAWSPDGTRLVFAANRHRHHDTTGRSMLFSVEVTTGTVTAIAGGSDAFFHTPTWLPDGSAVVALGERYPRFGYRTGIWRFAADGSDAGRRGGTDLLARSDLKPDAVMNSDLAIDEEAQLLVSADGALVRFTAPIEGSCELWQVATNGAAEPERLTEDRHHLSGWDERTVGGREIVVGVRSSGVELPEVVTFELGRRGRAHAGMRRLLTTMNDALAAEIAWVTPVERRWESDGQSIQGWLLPGGDGLRPLLLEIHGGPHTLYGWSPMLEWQILAGAGISVLASNPRGSEGYGEAFNRGNLGDWGDGPMADVLAGVDRAIADGLADPDRLGVTGGSYGGYLTNWIVGSTDRFRAAATCRSVADMRLLFLTGDISDPEWPQMEFGRTPWEDPDYYDSISPISLAPNIRTPLLIQHAEKDIRTTVGQAEQLFTVLRYLRRPVRFMRVPEDTHELTRSGTPFRRVENLEQVRDWFTHFLVRGQRRLPRPPRNRAGR